jgi:hypothetical protein
VQRLSIIVPLMGNLKRLEDTLVSVLENQPERSEIVVVLNAPYDDPYELRGEVKFVEAPPGADLIDSFVCGLAASVAPIVHTIAAGFEATAGWADVAMSRFTETDVSAVAPLVVDRENPDRILSAGLRWTTAGSIRRIAAGRRLDRFSAGDDRLCGPELGMSFYRRDVLESLEKLQHYGSDLITALDLSLAMRKAGYRSVHEPRCVITSTRELLASGGSWREGVANEQLFRRWSTVPGWRRSWAAHVAMLGMECLQLPLRPSMLARFAGRMYAALGLGAPRLTPMGPRVAFSPSGTLMRPHHFGTVDALPAMQSRVAG